MNENFPYFASIRDWTDWPVSLALAVISLAAIAKPPAATMPAVAMVPATFATFPTNAKTPDSFPAIEASAAPKPRVGAAARAIAAPVAVVAVATFVIDATDAAAVPLSTESPARNGAVIELAANDATMPRADRNPTPSEAVRAPEMPLSLKPICQRALTDCLARPITRSDWSTTHRVPSQMSHFFHGPQ